MSARQLFLAALLALASLQPAQAAVKDQAPNGFTLENSQWVPVDPATAWKAFVQDVGKWLRAAGNPNQKLMNNPPFTGMLAPVM